MATVLSRAELMHHSMSACFMYDLIILNQVVLLNLSYYSLNRRDLKDTYCAQNCVLKSGHSVQPLLALPWRWCIHLQTGNDHQNSYELCWPFDKLARVEWFFLLLSSSAIWHWNVPEKLHHCHSQVHHIFLFVPNLQQLFLLGWAVLSHHQILHTFSK